MDFAGATDADYACALQPPVPFCSVGLACQRQLSLSPVLSNASACPCAHSRIGAAVKDLDVGVLINNVGLSYPHAMVR